MRGIRSCRFKNNGKVIIPFSEIERGGLFCRMALELTATAFDYRQVPLAQQRRCPGLQTAILGVKHALHGGLRPCWVPDTHYRVDTTAQPKAIAQ